MAMSEYRHHAAECLSIADETTNPQHKMLLIAMAQAWLRLAQQPERNIAGDLVYESPSPPTETAAP
jgi:hypothetical protein